MIATTVVAEQVTTGWPLHDFLTKPLRRQDLLASLARAGVTPVTVATEEPAAPADEEPAGSDAKEPPESPAKEPPESAAKEPSAPAAGEPVRGR